MKLLVTLPALLCSVALLASTSAARSTLPELKVIPLRVLQRSISPKFYKSLTISPVDAHIVVRGSLMGTHLSGTRIVKSELGGRWDDLALKRAGEVVIAGNYSIDSPNYGHPVLVHLLIYNIADGTMALSFAHLDVPGGDQDYYFGCARLAVLKADGKWTDIKGPPGLEGQGWAVRSPGFRNDIKASLKLENIPGPRR
jgi:protein-S-isoprenylcysteine O-methyltransferase Ste14